MTANKTSLSNETGHYGSQLVDILVELHYSVVNDSLSTVYSCIVNKLV